MFESFKQIGKLRSLQHQLAQEKIEVSKNGVKVVMNGGAKIETIQLSKDLNLEDQEKILEDCLNEAMKKFQALAARKMSQL